MPVTPRKTAMHFVQRLVIVLLLFVPPLFCLGQSESIVLVIPNQEAIILLDGSELGKTVAGSAYRVATSPGEHYIEAKAIVGGSVKGEVVVVEAGKQKILKIEFTLIEAKVIQAIAIADLNISLPGVVEVIAWQSDNKDKPYPYPSFYYAFEKGDQIIIDASISNKKGTNILTVATYPDDVPRYSNNSFVELSNVSISVPERAIYKFTLGSNHAFPRNCFIKIKRIPASLNAASFNPTVSLKNIITPVAVHEVQQFFINSGSKATFSGGVSRVLLPITIPPQTKEWYYRFSASRDENDIKQVKSSFGLFQEISTLLFSGTGSAVSSLAIEALTMPPGANYCEVYLLTPESDTFFETKQDDKWQYYREGSRVNYKSGNVKIVCCSTGRFYLGIRNPDSLYGVHVSVEVVALMEKAEYVMDQQ